MKRRFTRGPARLGWAALVVTAALGISACGSDSKDAATSTTGAASPKLTKVSEAGFKVMSMAPVYTAMDRGLFKKHGLDFSFQEISSGKLGVAALLSNGVQFVDLGVDDVVNLQKQGKDIEFFYNLERPLTMDFVMRKDVAEKKGVNPSSPIKDRFKALQGLTIGVTRPGAPTDLYPRYFLKQVGVDPVKGAKFVPIGDASTLVGALKAKRIDGFMLSPPGPYLAQAQGFGTVLISGRDSLPVFKEYDFTTVAIRKGYATQHPDVPKAYTAAVAEATSWMAAHPDEALKLLHDKHFSETDLPTLKISFDQFMKAVNPNGEVTKTALQNQIGVLGDLDALKDAGSIDVDSLFTDDYATSATR